MANVWNKKRDTWHDTSINMSGQCKTIAGCDLFSFFSHNNAVKKERASFFNPDTIVSLLHFCICCTCVSVSLFYHFIDNVLIEEGNYFFLLFREIQSQRKIYLLLWKLVKSSMLSEVCVFYYPPYKDSVCLKILYSAVVKKYLDPVLKWHCTNVKVVYYEQKFYVYNPTSVNIVTLLYESISTTLLLQLVEIGASFNYSIGTARFFSPWFTKIEDEPPPRGHKIN